MKLYQKIAQTLQAIQDCEKSGNKEWYEKHNETLRNIENEYLPHGSGFDGDMGIFEGNTKKFIIRFDWHCMNDIGYYNGWLTIDCIVTANMANGFDLKISFYKSELQNDKAKVKKYKPLIEDFFYDEFDNILNHEI